MRLATVGALFLGLISIIPIAAQNVWGLPKIVALGGTSLLILIQVAIQAVKQLEGYYSNVNMQDLWIIHLKQNKILSLDKVFLYFLAKIR
mgnify:CR=1 FL=1